jgi:hypothetical protein
MGGMSQKPEKEGGQIKDSTFWGVQRSILH